MISTANITMQFGAKPLFEDISVKFGNGNRYGLIGLNERARLLGGQLRLETSPGSGTRLYIVVPVVPA